MAKLSSTSVYGNLYVDGEIVNNALDAELGQSIKSLSVNGKTITYTKNNGTTGTITTQDTNTTYGNATTSTSGLMSSADKTKLDGIATNANNYSHPTTSGNKHIPAGGSSGQILRWASDGTAAWGNDNNTTYSTGTASTAGLTKLYTGTGTATDGTMTQAAINTALNGKANSSHGIHMPSTCNTITDWNSATTTGWYMASGATNAPTANAWYFGEVIAHNANYVIQTVYQFTASTDAKAIPKYIRAKMNGTWGSWTNVTVAKAVPSNAVFTDTNTWRGVQDNLTSTATDQSLSANQGKVLKGLIDGKAASSHTHYYAGSSSEGGAANSATVLATTRKINGTSFNGSADITTANWGTARDINGISVNGSANYILPIENYYCNIQDNNTKLYHKILESGQVTGSWVDKSIILLVTNAYQGGGHGIVKITLRTNDISSSANASGEIRWLVRSGLAADSISFNIVNQSKNVYMDVFYKCPGTYGGLTWYVLSEGQRGSKHNKVWTKFNTSATSGAYTEAEMKALRSYTATLQTGSDSGQVASANILATARTINGTSFNGSANITTANWGTARTLTVGNTGKSVNGSGNVSWSLSEIGALPLTGGTLSGRLTANGRISAPTAGSSWISGMTITNATIGISTQQTTGSYHPVLAVKTSGNHVANIGGLGDDFGFYGFKSGRTENATDWSFKINAGTGAVSSTGNITAPTFVGALSGNASTATKATQDSAGQQINTTYIKGLSVSGKTITYTKGDGTTGTITTQDTNTTYSVGTASALGLTKLYTGTGTATDGTMTQSAINTALNGKANNSHTHNSITNQDTRNVNTTPTQMPLGLSVHLKSNSTDGLNDGGTYHSTLMIKGWEDVSGGPWAQMAVTANNNLYFRSSNNDTWNAWKKVSLDGHTHSYLPLSGGTVSGSINPPSDVYGSLGNSSLRWAEIHALTITATTLKGNATSAAKLSSARTINGTNFDGTGNITTANWGTARTLTVGNASKSVNGSGNVSWTLSEIGAAAVSHAQDFAGTGTNTFIAYPKDGRYRTNSHVHTGYLKVTLPQSWTNTMMRFTIEVYNYATNSSFEVKVGGYNYSSNSTWINAFAYITAHKDSPYRNLTVRLGHDGTKCAVYVGESTTTWEYCQMTVKDITVGYSDYELTKWNTGWAVGITTTLGTISSTISNTFSANGGAARTADTLATARTINGTSFNGSANITTANWGTARTITVGSTSKSVNGSGNVSWSLSEIGAAPALALANGYYGMVTNDGNSSNWIRTTLNGIIPYQSNGSGSSSLGTSGWPFSTVYATNFYGTLNGNATHWGGRQVWWGAAGSRPGNGYIQFVW